MNDRSRENDPNHPSNVRKRLDEANQDLRKQIEKEEIERKSAREMRDKLRKYRDRRRK